MKNGEKKLPFGDGRSKQSLKIVLYTVGSVPVAFYFGVVHLTEDFVTRFWDPWLVCRAGI